MRDPICSFYLKNKKVIYCIMTALVFNLKLMSVCFVIFTKDRDATGTVRSAYYPVICTITAEHNYCSFFILPKGKTFFFRFDSCEENLLRLNVRMTLPAVAKRTDTNNPD